ncbi:MAG: N-acetyl-gamma-glutamyl-phosphate reductase [Dictyoglomus sp. NZ13-RE01]|nr:MAG: N-acetyl-gamma-glutamyl-phosphate reductase [Dictyoglomus sp. NZ13-RE01]
MKIKVSILGATGYTGVELVRILLNHKHVEIVNLTSQSYVGKAYWEVYPHFFKHIDKICVEDDVDNLINSSDCIFTALPHGNVMHIAEKIINANKVLIDLGADFRLKNPKVYEEWYKIQHLAKDLIKKAVYGLPELHRDEIRNAKLVANPGCYPTSIILALAPAIRNDIIKPESIIIDSKSGVSGAGRSARVEYLFCEVNENIKAYSVPNHRHIPEIEQELSLLAEREIRITFTPHLIPMNRGILSTIYTELKSNISQDEIREIYEEFYQREKFIRLLPPGILPSTKNVSGTNYCDINIVKDERTNRLIILSAIDNLIKGAVGQAVQNMNIIFGFEETEGLINLSIYP